MPITIPRELPAYTTLERENIFVIPPERAMRQDIRPLRIGIFNLMPTKIETETQLLRLLSNSPLQIDITLLRTATYSSKNIAEEHLDNFYCYFDEIKDKCFDGFIITGAPIEHIPFEEVTYWRELCEIMEWSKKHVYSTLHICWGAFAGLYYHHGINKYMLPKKLSGVYPVALTEDGARSPLMRGCNRLFYVPHSRYACVHLDEVLGYNARDNPLQVLSAGADCAKPPFPNVEINIAATENLRRIYITGHAEYDEDTLKGEYLRDTEKGLNADVPYNYFENDDPAAKIIPSWRGHATIVFSNWLNHVIYQGTPYEIEGITEL